MLFSTCQRAEMVVSTSTGAKAATSSLPRHAKQLELLHSCTLWQISHLLTRAGSRFLQSPVCHLHVMCCYGRAAVGNDMSLQQCPEQGQQRMPCDRPKAAPKAHRHRSGLCMPLALSSSLQDAVTCLTSSLLSPCSQHSFFPGTWSDI